MNELALRRIKEQLKNEKWHVEKRRSRDDTESVWAGLHPNHPEQIDLLPAENDHSDQEVLEAWWELAITIEQQA